MKKYFGTDGIRFIYDKSILSTIKKLARALSTFKTKKIIIATDTRYSKDEILNTLINYIDTNIQIDYVGELSTPGICYLSLKHKCLGIVITASHNDYRYNGIKVFNNGFKLKEKEIVSLESEMDKEGTFIYNQRKIPISHSLKEEYLYFLKKHIHTSNLKFVFDLANGALSSYGERIANSIGTSNHVINNKPDGYNINKNAGALFPELTKQYVIDNNLDFGFCFDGDADRIILVDKENVYTGDQLMYYLCNNLKIKKDTVVITPYSNKGFINSLSDMSIKTHIVPPGDENILEYLIQNKLSLGGENAGHIILPDILPTGDGLLNAIIIASFLETNPIKKTLSNYATYPNEMINLKIKNKNIVSNQYISAYMRACKETFKEELDFFIRLSGTENLLRVYICHKDKYVVNLIKNKIITLIKVFDNEINTTNVELLYIDENSTFGTNVTLNGPCHITNSTIKDNVYVHSSVIDNSSIDDNSQIGPFAHIHKGSTIGKENRIGNFTEIKKSITGSNTKASHLSYIGDGIIGSNVNIGCGTIFVNYDGLNKTSTIIKDNAFIGCNSNLISPIIIGENTYIAAGTTITTNIEDNAFVIGRAKATSKENKAFDYPYYKKTQKKR